MSPLDLTFLAALLAIVGAIAVIDFRTMLIPDPLNALLAATGFAWQWLASGVFPLVSLGFAGAMLAGFWLLREGHRRARGVAGLGLGDVKMASASALWFSPWNLPLFLFVAAVSALVYAAVAIGIRRPDMGKRLPFGPFIGLGLVATWTLERMSIPTFIPDRGF